MMPGETNGVHTLQVNGELITDKDRIDEELSRYWKKVFTKKATDDTARNAQAQWLKATDKNFQPPEQFDIAKNTRRDQTLQQLCGRPRRYPLRSLQSLCGA